MYKYDPLIKIREEDKRLILDSIAISPLLVGATTCSHQYMPSKVMHILNISPRESSRNKFKGTITTHPEWNVYAVGLNYYDTKDGVYDEDIIEFDFNLWTVRKYYKGTYIKVRPEYGNYHHKPNNWY